MAETGGTFGRALRFWARLPDGAILRHVFFALLVGTMSVLAVDFFELSRMPDPAMPAHPGITPILPAAPTTAPGSAAQPDITTPREALAAPLSISLQPGGVLEVTGAILPGSAKALEQELAARGEYIETVSLNSPGGIVDEAMTMGRLIRQAGYATRVDDGHLCASSCPLVFAGGAKRQAGQKAAIGVHQIFAGATQPGAQPEGAAQAMSGAQAKTAIITRYLTEMGADPALWLHALETPPQQLYYFSSEELTGYRLVTAIAD